MKSFEEKKNEYMNLLLNNEKVLITSVFNGMNATDIATSFAYKILLNPESEAELVIANSLYSLADNFMTLGEEIEEEKIERVPISENEGFKFIINTMNMKYNKEEIETYIDSIDPKSLARIVYDYSIGVEFEDQADEYIASKTNLNLNDPEDLFEWKMRYENAAETLEGITLLRNFDEKEIERLVEFSNEMSKLREKGRIKKDNQKRLDN